MSLTAPSLTYKPFSYPWAFEAWQRQQQIHWLPEEVPLAEDVRDWEKTLTPAEKHLLTQIFRFFTQADVEVNDCYHRHYLSVFKPTEIVMMLTAFSNMETIHIAAYSHLLDTIGMPETEYAAFLKYEQMKAKHDYLQSFDPHSPSSMAATMAAFGAFTEGMQLFASFAILLNFPRFNKMKGMGQIVTWSVRDETLHCNSVIRLYHEYVKENQHRISMEGLSNTIQNICREMVEHEDAFIDLAFEQGDIEGLTADDVKQYIRYIANMRMRQLKQPELYDAPVNPLPWLETMLNDVEFANFFEARATEYTKGATGGDWSDVWGEVDS